jgi:hypothetical protein
MRPVLVGSHVEDNRTEKELPMNEYLNIPTDPDSRNAVSRRIVEVTDEDETIFAEFIDLGPLDAGRTP